MAIEGVPYLSQFRPILNEQRCFHCHGSSRKVLGGMQIRSSIQEAYVAATDSRNKGIILGIIGLVVLIFTLISWH